MLIATQIANLPNGVRSDRANQAIGSPIATQKEAAAIIGTTAEAIGQARAIIEPIANMKSGERTDLNLLRCLRSSAKKPPPPSSGPRLRTSRRRGPLRNGRRNFEGEPKIAAIHYVERWVAAAGVFWRVRETLLRGNAEASAQALTKKISSAGFRGSTVAGVKDASLRASRGGDFGEADNPCSVQAIGSPGGAVKSPGWELTCQKP